ncbi:MAG: PQQ-dependent sugar dehydrogenase, partial [Phycisphaerae bacterium]
MQCSFLTRIGTSIVGMALVASTIAAAPPMAVRIHASGLQQPLAITHAPGDSTTVYVVQRLGKIAAVDAASGAVRSLAWLDLTATVRAVGDGGLLGIAFDPNFQRSGFVYVYFTRQPDSQGTLMRFTVNPVTRVPDPASGIVILTHPRFSGGHNGGWIGFSPLDGFLYMGLGDAGTGTEPDPLNSAQTLRGLPFQGKVVRIDPSGDDFPLDAARNYRIPASNPFVATTNDPEIWAYGLRNPWRCSFDRATGDLWIADVGHDLYEEINVERAGHPGGSNYGWKCMEGPVCTPFGSCGPCPVPGLSIPTFAYDHDMGHSITGGVVYRGSAIPGLVGSYVFADWSDGKLFTLRAASAGGFEDVTSMVEPGGSALLYTIAAIGEDAAGEIYLADWLRGRLLKLVPRPAGACCLLAAPWCDTRSVADCLAAGGVYRGDGTTCDASCVGACCLPDGTCDVLIAPACLVAGGTYQGHGTTCEGACTTSPCMGDFNQDGGVDGSDVFAFFDAWQ